MKSLRLSFNQPLSSDASWQVSILTLFKLPILLPSERLSVQVHSIKIKHPNALHVTTTSADQHQDSSYTIMHQVTLLGLSSS